MLETKEQRLSFYSFIHLYCCLFSSEPTESPTNPVLCPIAGQVFQTCQTCPATCSNPGLICTLQCVPGCGCPSGQVKMNVKYMASIISNYVAPAKTITTDIPFLIRSTKYIQSSLQGCVKYAPILFVFSVLQLCEYSNHLINLMQCFCCQCS